MTALKTTQLELWRLEWSAETVTNVHSAAKCAGGRCPIHNLTNHPLRHWPQHFRADAGKMERICPHGIGHPDPDDAYNLAQDDGAHGCDVCCAVARDSILRSREERAAEVAAWEEDHAAEAAYWEEERRLEDYDFDCAAAEWDA